jgi:hypothetical protein
VPGLDGNRSLKFTQRVVQKALLLIEQSEIVVRLGVELVSFEQGAIVLQRPVEITGALKTDR